jgi:hypothetical protein
VDATGSNGARPRVRITGSLGQVRAGAPGAPPMLRAELAGGRDAVTVIWLGRNRITGIEPGRALSVEGTLALRRGRPVIYNPRYELGQGPVTKEWGLEPAEGSGGSPPRAGTGPRPGGSVPG